MKMYELLSLFNKYSIDKRYIDDIVFDIDKITRNTVYILIKKDDLKKYKKVLKRKPLYIISAYENYGDLYVENLKEYLSKIFIKFYDIDFSKIKLIAITGTEMKSSLAKLLFDIYQQNNIKTLLISASFEGKDIYYSSLTTPPCNEMLKIINYAVTNNYKNIIFEASSIGINEGRLNEIIPNELILTNLNVDHLDYHKTITSYYESKKKYVLLSKKVYAYKDEIIKFNDNIDFIDINKVDEKEENKFINFSYLQKSMIPYLLTYTKNNNLIIDYNNLFYPEGRIEVLNKNPLVMIDYAHTFSSFKKVCSYFSTLINGKKIIVFGLGGNRDRSKRKPIGEIASSYFDKVILTEDNSRNERFKNIVNDVIEDNIDDFIVIKNRKKAIKFAFKNLSNNDGILIIGKGIEKNIIRKHRIIKHSDKDLAIKLINRFLNK